jgi:uncharacterized heparinase superfamily protein
LADAETIRTTARRRPTLGERAGVARAAMATAVGVATSALSLSPLLRWRHGRHAANSLVILPRDLRSADPAFYSELLEGQICLAGTVVVFGDGSPFDHETANEAVLIELHGFGWLRHLGALADDHDACLAAGELVDDWIARFGTRRDDLAWTPAVTARRALAWMAHAGVVLAEAEPEAYDRFMRSLGDHLVFLAGCWSTGRDGVDRLLAAVARVAGDVCVEGRESYLARSCADLGNELARQIDEDGCHVSRNPDAIVEVLLDLLPVQHCMRARDLPVPPAIQNAIARAMPMLRFLRLGRGLARFNGADGSQLDVLASVLAQDPGSGEDDFDEPGPDLRSGYARLAAGETVVVADVGKSPPAQFGALAHAGALSFEMAVGGELVVVNSGAPPSGPRGAARGTSSHSTLELGDRSSATLAEAAALLRVAGGPPLVMHGRVVGEAGDDPTGAGVLEAWHEGYLHSLGLVHRRRLTLAAGGMALEGVDRISGPRDSTVRLRTDQPFAIRFHLATSVKIAGGPWADAVDLVLANGQRWRLEVTGAILSLDSSRRYASSGVAQGLQVVLRGTTFGESEVRWRLHRRD